MTISLSPKAQKALEERMRRGGYATPEEALLAGLASLEQQEAYGDFAPGELDELLAEGEADIQRGDLLDAKDVFDELRFRAIASGRLFVSDRIPSAWKNARYLSGGAWRA